MCLRLVFENDVVEKDEIASRGHSQWSYLVPKVTVPATCGWFQLSRASSDRSAHALRNALTDHMSDPNVCDFVCERTSGNW